MGHEQLRQETVEAMTYEALNRINITVAVVNSGTP